MSVSPRAAPAVEPLRAVPTAETPGNLGRIEFIALVAALMALNALALDILLPAFPLIGTAFALTDSADASILLVAYILGFGLGQPVFGPVSDRFGRRAPLFFGGALYAVAAVAALIAPSFAALLALRFLQGLGAASTRVIALAVVRDTMAGRAMASTMSLVMMVFMIVPIFAPLVGQGLIAVGSWQTVFLFMAVLCLGALVWVAFRLPETLPPERRRPLSGRSVFDAFRQIVTHRTAFGYALATASIFSALFGFLTLAQPIYVGVYGLGEWFGVAFGGVAVLMAVTSLANSWLVRRFGERRLSHGAVIGFLGLSVVLMALSLETNPPFWLFYGLIALLMPLFGLIGANLNALAMEPLGHVAGSGSAVLGFLQSAIGGLVGGVMGLLFAGKVAVFSVGLVGVSAAALLMILYAEKGRLFREQPA